MQLALDTSEAEQALRIIHKQVEHQTVTVDDWRLLFQTTPYQWLQAREAAMGRTFTDGEFQAFLLSPEALAKEHEWDQVLTEMKRANVEALGAGVLAWLPAGATIHACVFPEIKPKTNSFVWTKNGEGPAIFLYLERQNKAQFENTISYECHHIGLASLENQQDEILATRCSSFSRTFWMAS